MDVKELRRSFAPLNEKEERYRDHPELSLHGLDPQGIPQADGTHLPYRFPLPPGSGRVTLYRQNRFVTIPPHTNDHFFEINYVYAGTASLLVDEKVRLDLAAGDLVMFDTDVNHRLLPLGEEDTLLYLLFPISTLEEFARHYLPTSGGVSRMVWDSMNARRSHDRFLHLSTEASPTFRALIEQAYCEYLGHEVNADSALECYLSLIFIELARCYRQAREQEESQRNRAYPTEILTYMGDHCADCTLTSVARHFGYNPSYLSRLIREETGRTFKQRVTEMRLNNISRQLVATEDPIATIARAWGYGNLTVFYEKFHDRFGCTPKEYRSRSLGAR